jgi:hypothetical protein
MKKRSLLLITALMLAFSFMSGSAVAAKPSESGVIDCDLYIEYGEHDDCEDTLCWLGKVTGPKCDVEGTIRFDAVGEEYFYPGNTMHFVETFTIAPYSGGFIEGKDWGVWNYSTFKFRANGWVTEASPQWADLAGAHHHEMGVTSDPFADPPVTLETYDGAWMKIAPGNRPPDTLP